VGGVARAWSKPYEGITDLLIAEALALIDGVIFARLRLRGYANVVMETDWRLFPSRTLVTILVQPWSYRKLESSLLVLTRL
jgi:hypothetical protein